MCHVLSVVEYPAEGFAIITDTAGKYLAFSDTLDTVDLDDEFDISFEVDIEALVEKIMPVRKLEDEALDN